MQPPGDGPVLAVQLVRRGPLEHEVVGELQDRQQDLSHIVEQVGVRTGELGRLMGVATAALAVLRSPLKYLGK